jgi:hypothetical protein
MTYLLAGLKQGAWLSRTSQYNTDIKQAAVFDREEALERCRKHKAASNILLPVRQEDLDAI